MKAYLVDFYPSVRVVVHDNCTKEEVYNIALQKAITTLCYLKDSSYEVLDDMDNPAGTMWEDDLQNGDLRRDIDRIWDWDGKVTAEPSYSDNHDDDYPYILDIFLDGQLQNSYYYANEEERNLDLGICKNWLE